MTNDQTGHEVVKTEQFLVPIGSVVVIPDLKFAPGSSQLSRIHEFIVQQVFNSLEEITENTVGDTNSARVAEFKKMEFEICGYPDASGNAEVNTALANERAKAVLDRLVYLGTPAWRLRATGAKKNEAATKQKCGTVEFIRIK